MHAEKESIDQYDESIILYSAKYYVGLFGALMPRRVLEGTVSSQKPATSTPRGNLHGGNNFLRRDYFLLTFLRCNVASDSIIDSTSRL